VALASSRKETYDERATGGLVVAGAALLAAILLFSQNHGSLVGLSIVLDALFANAIVIASHRSSSAQKSLVIAAILSGLAAIAAGSSPLALWYVVLIAFAFSALYMGTLIGTTPPHVNPRGSLLRSWALLSVATVTLVQAVTEAELVGSPQNLSVAEAGLISTLILAALLFCDDQLFPNRHLMLIAAVVPAGMLGSWLALLMGGTGIMVLLLPTSVSLVLCARLLRQQSFSASASDGIRTLEAAGLAGILLATYLWGFRQQTTVGIPYGGYPAQWTETGEGIALLIAETAAMIALGATLRRKMYAIVGAIGLAIAALLALNLLSSTFPLWEIVAGVAALLLIGAGIAAAWSSETGESPLDLAKSWRTWD